MQVLMVLAPGHGHLYPTFGVAEGLRSAGHGVTYAMVGDPSLRQRVVSQGHRFVAVPPSLPEQREIIATGLRVDPSLAGIFGPLAPPAVGPLVSLITDLDARLVLHDMASFAAPLAAAVRGVPSAHFGVGPSFPDESYAAGRRMAPLWQQWGRQPDELAGMFGLAYFDPFPASLDNPARTLQDRSYPYRPVPFGSYGQGSVRSLPRPPWVWVTLGTVFNANPTAWERLAAELADLGAQVVATVGEGVDVNGLPRFPPNFTVLSFVPAQVMLEGAVAVLCHAGAGTLLGGLYYGLPLVCWPQGADQFHNARACATTGASVTINEDVDAAYALRTVLEGDGFRVAARRLRQEILAMPSPADCALVLEQLAR
jgi:UDP:flavonoid glycosyltransferase YjiC (YdhE family)